MKLVRVWSTLFFLLITFILGVSIYATWTRSHIQPKSFPLGNLKHLPTDWTSLPLIDLVTTTAKKCPKTHPDPTFHLVWPGIYNFCDCSKVAGKTIVYYRRRNKNRRRPRRVSFIVKPFYVKRRCPVTRVGRKRRIVNGCEAR